MKKKSRVAAALNERILSIYVFGGRVDAEIY